MFRNEWRKYYKSIVEAFGGNKIAYLSGCSLLDNILYYHHSFKKVEKKLKKNYVEPLENFSDVLKYMYEYFGEPKENYFIDDFSIPMNTHYLLEKLLPEPAEYDNMGTFDVNKCKEDYHYLFDVLFTEEYMMHKKENNRIYFCHLAYRDDLFVMRTGEIGKEDTSEIVIDSEMPFKFKKIYYEIKEQGFTSTLLKNYDIELDESDDDYENYWSFIDKLRHEIILRGIGLSDVESSENFYVVKKKLFLEVLVDLLEKESKPPKLKIYDWIKDKHIFYNC